jgi:hypothetical protein
MASIACDDIASPTVVANFMIGAKKRGDDMTLTRKLFAAGALTALIAFPISGAFAQSSMGDSGSSASSAGSMGGSPNSSANASSASAPAQTGQIDDATLQKAAKAYVKVKQIVHQSKEVDSGANPQPATQSDKLNAVREEGLEPQQYNQILETVQNDPQLLQKFAAYVNQNGGDAD